MDRSLFFFSLWITLTGIMFAGCTQEDEHEQGTLNNNDENTEFLSDGITAHRGNSSEFPENTIIAFQSAIDLGVDWTELDLRMTKDSILVVIHDENTKRTGDKNLVVAESTYDQLLEVDVASDYRQKMMLDVQNFPPQHIPTLEEVLHLLLNQNRTRVTIDLKVNVVEAAVELIEDVGAGHMVGFNSGNLNRLRTAKQLAPHIPVFYSKRDVSTIDQDIITAKEYGFESMMIHHASYSELVVSKLKTAEIGVAAWTVNDLNSMKRLLLMGVEHIFTDHPSKLFELKKEDFDIRTKLLKDGYK